jgi:hypothetical protein
MFNQRRDSFDSTPEETTTIANDFEHLFRTQPDSVLGDDDPTQSNFLGDPKTPQLEVGELDTPEEKSESEFGEKERTQAQNGNCQEERKVNNQATRRAVNRISKEMKKCSKEFFRRAYAKEKKNVLFVAKQVSF